MHEPGHVRVCAAGGIARVAVHVLPSCESPLLWRLPAQESARKNRFVCLFHIPERFFVVFIQVSVAKHCPRLRELVVGANGNTTIDSELIGVANNCPHLTSLGLGECEVCTNINLIYIDTQINISNVSLRRIIDNWHCFLNYFI
jgi:hypothetical protein